MLGEVQFGLDAYGQKIVCYQSFESKRCSSGRHFKGVGHKRITTTMKYLRVGIEENADLLAESSYYTLGTTGDGGKELRKFRLS